MKHLVSLSALAATMLLSGIAQAVPFTTSYTDGETWNSIYAQGFSAFVEPSPDPEVDFLDPVYLDRFQFYKSGNADVAMPVKLAIVDNFFLNLDELTVSHANLIGLSSNSIDDTATIAVGDPLTFNFDSLELTYALDYAAIYVTEGEVEGELIPVLMPSLITDYVETEPESGIYVPESDYGDPDLEYQYAASNFINSDEFGSFLAAFGAPYGDANFTAYFNLEPLPGDYNNDGVVDAADYTVWRDNLNTSNVLPNETVTPGQVTQEDYDEWVSNFGATSGLSAISESQAVPEPTSLLLLAAAVCMAQGVRPSTAFTARKT